MPSDGTPAHCLFLMTSVRPDHGGIGTIFIRDILTAAPDIDLHWRVVPPFVLGAISARRGAVWRAATALMTQSGIVNDLRLSLFLRWRLRGLADRLEREFRRSGAARIWVTTSSPEIICVAAELARRGIDLRVTVWDAPEYLIQNLRLSRRMGARILGRFEALLRHARGCSVVSDGMRDAYAARIPELPLVPMRHGIAPLAGASRRGGGGPVRIVFAGSLYAKREWNAFVRALDAVGWQVAGQRIELEFLGVFPLRDVLRPAGLVLRPPMPQPEALRHITGADIGYLPYWLDPAHDFVARTSFPGKMTVYSAAGLAIFHHGPADSSVSRFLSRYPYGVACASLDADAILGKLDCLVRALGRPSMREARRRAMEDALSDAAMMRGFRTLVEAAPSDACSGRVVG